jgi:hypothetical protein
MTNLNSTEYIYKYGKLVQFGTNFMIGFSSFADEFHNTISTYTQEMNDYGYSIEWNNWKKQRVDSIIQLHNELEEAGLIPTAQLN